MGPGLSAFTWKAIPFPIPWLAPVTIAILPLSSKPNYPFFLVLRSKEMNMKYLQVWVAIP